MIFDLDFLNQCFTVDFTKGVMYWKEDRPSSHFPTLNGHQQWKKRFASTQPTGINHKGYFCVGITDGSKYTSSVLQHRIIYALFHNDPNPPTIDHYDRITTNNSISNLRPSNAQNNARNRKKSKRNTSGITGVRYETKKSGYAFWITKSARQNGPKTISFQDFFLACCERKAWELIHSYSKDHGTEIKS